MSSRSTEEMQGLIVLSFLGFLLLPRRVKLTRHKNLCENLFHFHFPINSRSGQSEAANTSLVHLRLSINFISNNFTATLAMDEFRLILVDIFHLSDTFFIIFILWIVLFSIFTSFGTDLI